MPKRERNPIYVERPKPVAARKIWDALVAAGFQKINLWFEDIGNALEMCGPTGGWQFQDESGSGEWLGYGWGEAIARAREMGVERSKRKLKSLNLGDFLDADFERVLDSGIHTWIEWCRTALPPDRTGSQSLAKLKDCLKRAFDKW